MRVQVVEEREERPSGRSFLPIEKLTSDLVAVLHGAGHDAWNGQIERAKRPPHVGGRTGLDDVMDQVRLAERGAVEQLRPVPVEVFVMLEAPAEP